MQNQNLDIVQLIEKNPLTRLSKNYHSRLLTKIKNTFTDNEQQLFVTSFYCYLNYTKDDFVICLDSVWKWSGFARIDPAKRVIEKNFTKDIDYKILLHQVVEQTNKENTSKNNRGGHNKEEILMTVNTFKKFCLKANTKKADEIHKYHPSLTTFEFALLTYCNFYLKIE